MCFPLFWYTCYETGEFHPLEHIKISIFNLTNWHYFSILNYVFYVAYFYFDKSGIEESIATWCSDIRVAPYKLIFYFFCHGWIGLEIIPTFYHFFIKIGHISVFSIFVWDFSIKDITATSDT